jgi:ribosome-associated toxin RatA of RatAB toxin-antitoxin module
MTPYQVTASAAMNAPAEQVYNIIADYRNGHPHILPKQFSNLVVEEGGYGAGTRIRFSMTAFGQTRTAEATITEPEPGRVLVETAPDESVITTFTVIPLEGGRSQVTFATDLKSRSGFLGVLERFMSTKFLQRVYREELAMLAALAEKRARG